MFLSRKYTWRSPVAQHDLVMLLTALLRKSAESRKKRQKSQ
jgi:hypothetical protein